MNANYIVPSPYNRDNDGLDMVGTVLYNHMGLLLVLINGDALICDFSGDELNKLHPGIVPFMMEIFDFQSETQAKEIFADCVRQMKTIQYDTEGEFVEFLRMTAGYQQLLHTYINSVVDSSLLPSYLNRGTVDDEVLPIELTGTTRHREILPVLHGITKQVWVKGQPFIIERGNNNDGRTTDGVGVGNTGLGDPNVADGSRGSEADDEESPTDGDWDGAGDGDDNENDTYIANETINLVSDEELSYDDNFIGQSKNVKQRATATGQRKGATANTTDEQRESKALLEEKELKIKDLQDKLQGRGELLIVPDDSEFDIFFIDYHDDDISEVLYRKDSLIKILNSRLHGIY